MIAEMPKQMKRSISFKEMRQLNPKVLRCEECGAAALQPTVDYYGSGISEADPVIIDEDLIGMLFQLTTAAIAPTNVGPAPAQVFVMINPDQSISDPVQLQQERPAHTSNFGGVKYPPGYERYDAYFHIAAYILLELKQGNCGSGARA